MQKKIANIVTEYKKLKFDLPTNMCDSMDCVDETLPTLIIGYELAKKYIKNFNVLKKHYPEQNIYWTFRKNERGYDYEDDIINFKNEILHSVCDKTKYCFIDCIGMTERKFIKLVKYALSDDEKYVFNENGRFLYLYSPRYATVFGFSLSTSRFFGFNTQKFIKKLKEVKSNTFFYEFSKIPNSVKQLIGAKIDKYMVLSEYFLK